MVIALTPKPRPGNSYRGMTQVSDKVYATLNLSQCYILSTTVPMFTAGIKVCLNLYNFTLRSKPYSDIANLA